jgi:glutamate 5-kinase
MASASPRKPKSRRRWVIKVGSRMVCGGGPLLLRHWMHQVSVLRRRHRIDIVWVTSGAIASAVERTDYRKPDRKLSEKQALSAIGQPQLMDLYNLSLQATGLLGAQILLTYDDMRAADRRRNLQTTLEQLLAWQVVPILNENDAVATEEIKFGDNDRLSAKVATLIGADRLVIGTDVAGLYDKNPADHADAALIHQLDRVTPAWLGRVGRSAGSAVGTGGMYSKLVAAREAARAGIETWLVKGDIPDVLLQVALDRPVGTRIGVKA